MRRSMLIVAAGAASLTLAGCNKPAEAPVEENTAVVEEAAPAAEATADNAADANAAAVPVADAAGNNSADDDRGDDPGARKQ